MAYIDAGADPAARTKAAISVIAIHALLGAGLVAGLAVTGGIIDKDDTLTGTEVTLDPPPPPPDETLPEPTDTTIYTAPQAPTPPLDLNPAPPVPLDPVSDSPLDVVRDVTPLRPSPGPAATPAPTPAFTPVAARPANDTRRWITNDDYSNIDIRREREGIARYRLVIGSNGRVDACEITGSTGYTSLDAATCRLIERRARFDPATNNQGERVVGTYIGSVTWQIPE